MNDGEAIIIAPKLNAAFVCRQATVETADAMRQPFSEVLSKGRGSRAAQLARHISIYLFVCESGRTNAEAKRCFRRHHTTVHHSLHIVENLRDVEEFDVFLELLSERFKRGLVYIESRLQQDAWIKARGAIAVAGREADLEGDSHDIAEHVGRLDQHLTAKGK